MSEKRSSRTLINIIGIPSILSIIIVGDSFHNIPIFSIFICVVLLLGAKEVPIFVKELNAAPYLPILFIFLILLQKDRHPLINFYIKASDLVISITLITMIFELFRKKKTPLINISCIVFTFIWLGLMLGSLSLIRNIPIIGCSLTMALFLSVWICDTAAFGFGVKFGNSRILPSVSPNKTWVGSIAGMISSVITMIVLYKINIFSNNISQLDALFLGIITGIFGQLGDFAESLLKREANIKDTSNFLRGHGGILDRFDSLAFVAPIALLYYNYFI